MQFTLRWLFALVTLAGVATYSLVYASPLWATLWFTFDIALLLVASVFALIAARRARAFWLGVTIFGWGYWFVLHSPLLDMEADFYNWRLQNEGPPLASSTVLEWMYYDVLSKVHIQPQFDGFGNLLNNSRYPAGPAFMRVGHAIFDVIVAMFGGWIATKSFKTAGAVER